MQLVVMAAVLALVGAGQDCIFECHPVNVSIPVESCGRVESVSTTICEGHCYHEDTVFINYNDRDKQVCLADWAYEVKHFHGCPVAVTYPVARQCKCGVCNENNTFCGRLSGGISSCPSF